MNSPKRPSPIGEVVRALGPALIVASVVLGPGSILSSSKVGAAYGYSMFWVVLLAAGLMMGMVAMGARLGIVLTGTMCDELAARIGRPFAALVGLTIFLICAGFQFGNNLGVLAATESLREAASSDEEQASQQEAASSDKEKQAGDQVAGVFTVQNAILVVLNLAIVRFLYLFRRLYKPVETMMKVLVTLMILAFVGNFIYLLFTGGAPPGAAAISTAAIKPTDERIVAVLGLMGTTFSIAGAFYQAYLVREKGWGMLQLKQGLIDSVAGISVLGTITLVIMLTAAMSFYGTDVELKSATDVAQQLKPLFGPAAVVLFSLGIFAAAFSSFLVNAMIGGAMLSDGLGLGGSMDSASAKAFTTLALAVGMIVAMFVSPGDRVGLIVFAQAMVVIGFPLLAFSMLYLASRPDLTGERRVPQWMLVVGVLGLVVVLTSAVYLASVVFEKLT